MNLEIEIVYIYLISVFGLSVFFDTKDICEWSLTTPLLFQGGDFWFELSY